jgi:hypothetical protein
MREQGFLRHVQLVRQNSGHLSSFPLQLAMQRPNLPKHIQILFLVFFIANLTHFAHNAEYIAYYPGLPAWLTREKVYLAWAFGVSVGLAGLLIARSKLKLLGVALVAAYGATGIDGLAHYTLALCSEHTLATNLTIWFEVLAGLSLLLASSLLIGRMLSQRIPSSP